MRLFNLSAGAPVLKNVDVCGEAGGMNKEVVKVVKGIRGDETLTISLGAQKKRFFVASRMSPRNACASSANSRSASSVLSDGMWRSATTQDRHATTVPPS